MALLGPRLPGAWRLSTTEDNFDKLDTILLQLRQEAIVRHPQAPFTKHLVEFDARLIVPGVNFRQAEDRLDAAIEKFLFVVDSFEGVLHWSRAEKAQVENKYMAYLVTLTVTTEKPKE